MSDYYYGQQIYQNTNTIINNQKEIIENQENLIAIETNIYITTCVIAFAIIMQITINIVKKCFAVR